MTIKEALKTTSWIILKCGWYRPSHWRTSYELIKLALTSNFTYKCELINSKVYVDMFNHDKFIHRVWYEYTDTTLVGYCDSNNKELTGATYVKTSTGWTKTLN